jgi:hypothetical protein
LVYIFLTGSTGLRRFILTRIALTLPMVFILATLVFFIMRVLPGDPVTSALGPKGTPEMVQRIREQLGINDPIPVQYVRFLKDMVTLDFGNSLTGGHRPIIDEMSERFPATLELVIPASVLALVVGIVGGAFAASRRKAALDYGWASIPDHRAHLLVGLDAATPVWRGSVAAYLWATTVAPPGPHHQYLYNRRAISGNWVHRLGLGSPGATDATLGPIFRGFVRLAPSVIKLCKRLSTQPRRHRGRVLVMDTP